MNTEESALHCGSDFMRHGLAVLAGVVLVSACATGREPVATANATPVCVPAERAPFATGTIRVLRLVTDPTTRDSRLVESVMDPKITPLLSTGGSIREFNFGPAGKAQIVSGPPNFDIPLHPAPYRESFLLIEGSIDVVLGDGTTFVQRPGDMLVMEDTDAIRGHGGRTGPCGYVAVNFVPG